MRFKQIVLGILVFSFIFSFFSCGEKPKTQKLHPAFMWTQDQNIISPSTGMKHAWTGFYVKDNAFVSFKDISKLILWRTMAESKEITIQYFLKGKAVDLWINRQQIDKLKPASGSGTYRTNIQLKKGFNFFEFRKENNSQLKIKFLAIGEMSTKKSYDLIKGETLTIPVSKGKGYLVLKGKGKLELRTVEFKGGEKSISKTDLSSPKIKYAFQVKSEGFVQLNCLSGWFNVDDFQVSKTKPKSVVPGKMVEGLPNIFIFVIDGCQPSHLGIYGYFRDTSPNIDRMAKDAVIFKNAYANATFTRSSIATLFTGFLPQRHQLRIMVNKLSDKLFLLPEFLKKIGYKTSIYTEAGNIARKFGFTQGVDDYKKMFRRWDDPRYLKQNIPDYFKKWTDTHDPIFTYIHFRAPHFPIIPPPPFLDMFKRDKSLVKGKRTILKLNKLLKAGHKFSKEEISDITADYDSAICYVDSQLGKLFQRLRDKKMYDNSLIIFTSDHGEAIYEHGAMGHGNNVYDETSKIPLIIKFPKSMSLKGDVDIVVQLADIFPTISAMFGETGDFDGQPLFDSIKRKSINDNFAISTTFNLIPEFGIRWRNWYYIIGLRNNREQLFNIIEDPLTEVSEKKTDVITFFRGRFITWLNQQNNIAIRSESIDLNQLPRDVKENLKSLGYLD